jgi:cytochrome P450
MRGPSRSSQALDRKYADLRFTSSTRSFANNFQIVLPNRFADEIRSREELNFPKAFEKEFFVNYPGFDGHRQGLIDDWFIQDVTRIKLTQSLNLITHDLVDETTAAVHDIFGEDGEWHTTLLKEGVMELVGRLSSRVFLGLPLCRNRRWLDIAKTYTIDSFVASYIMRVAPPILRPITYWFIPQATRLRAEVRDARKLIMPEIERRKERARKALEAGQKPPKTADSIGWMYEVAKGREVDYVAAQLSLTLAAIHTTTEATAQALIHICGNPEVVQPMREEIIAVISENGWTKAALQKLRLMDSFLKESSRLSPLNNVSMNRFAMRELELSDGTVIPKGSRLMVANAFRDPAHYKDPEKFDAFRFANARLEAGQANMWGHVTTTASHMGFGHGQHACPGRFFASNEIKVALCHLLLKYDFDFVDGKVPEPMRFENGNSVDSKAEISLRRRKEEMCLDIDLEE